MQFGEYIVEEVKCLKFLWAVFEMGGMTACLYAAGSDRETVQLKLELEHAFQDLNLAKPRLGIEPTAFYYFLDF